MSGLAERLAQVKLSIAEECKVLGREVPKLIVVTKNHPVDLVNELVDLGERNFGENRVQEAAPKAELFNQVHVSTDAHWHLIGQLQTNKVRQALEFASTIHSLDRLSLLEELAKRIVARATPLEVFLQLNLTQDTERGGLQPEELLTFADRVADEPNIKLKGIMAVASLGTEPARDFEVVAKLSQRLQQAHSAANSLSIGMSGDYVTALGFGATHLRIGTAITGNRQI